MKKIKNTSVGYILKNRYILPLFLLLIFVVGCKEDEIGQPATSSEVPGSVFNVKVENTHGGAIITYDLPDTEDLLYVKAVYTRKGEEVNTNASWNTNQIVIEGFGDTEEHQVALYTVSRSNVYSTAVNTTIKPLVSPVNIILETLNVNAAFGGIKLEWKNKLGTDIAIYVNTEEDGELVEREVIYTNLREQNWNVRGLDSTLQMFSFVIRDRWNNFSDTIRQEFKPYHEELVPSQDITKYEGIIAGDRVGNMGAAVWRRMFDGDLNLFYMTGDQPYPGYITLDLNCTVHLSRFTMWQYHNYSYDNHTPRIIHWYGSNETPKTYESEEYWKPEVEGEGFMAEWTYLGTFPIHKPSGTGPATDEDREYARAGHQYDFDPALPPFRYLRMKIDDTFTGSKRLIIGELRFWGTIIND